MRLLREGPPNLSQDVAVCPVDDAAWWEAERGPPRQLRTGVTRSANNRGGESGGEIYGESDDGGSTTLFGCLGGHEESKMLAWAPHEMWNEGSATQQLGELKG